MPDRPTWADKIPEAIDAVNQMEPGAYLGVPEVMRLLGVERRRAQVIMGSIGASKLGNKIVVGADEMRVYLDTMGGGDAERARKKAMAQRFVAIEKEHIQKYTDAPKGGYEILPPEAGARRANVRTARLGLKHLPEGIEISKGMICIRCSGLQDAMEKLLALSVAAGIDLEELGARLKI